MKKIIIIEDDPVFKTYLAKLIMDLVDDAEIQQFSSFEEAEKVIHKDQPEWVFIDYDLGNLNGREGVVKISSLSRKTKTVMISGQKDVMILASVFNSGVYKYFRKDQQLSANIRLMFKEEHSHVSRQHRWVTYLLNLPLIILFLRNRHNYE